MKARDWAELLSGCIHSSKFAAFISGVDVDLPHGAGKIRVWVKKSVRSIRPPSLRWNEFSFYTVVVGSNGAQATGYGEASTEILAIQKGIAEGVERVVFRSLKGTPLEAKSSNGWAAHLTPSLAERSASYELLERDAVLLHWLSCTPMLELRPESFPRQLSSWMKNTLVESKRFNQVRLGVSFLGHIPTVTTFLLDAAGHGVFSHAADSDFDRALGRAMAETCRIAHVAEERSQLAGLLQGPMDHALAYTYDRKLPKFLLGQRLLARNLKTFWDRRFSFVKNKSVQLEVSTFPCGPLWVSRARSNQVQDLFFGETKNALKEQWINKHRVTKVRGFHSWNLLPHFVP